MSMDFGTVIVADRWYPSSRICPVCKTKNVSLTIEERFWTCQSCGTIREVNASVNLAQYPESWSGSACGAEGAGDENYLAVKSAA